MVKFTPNSGGSLFQLATENRGYPLMAGYYFKPMMMIYGNLIIRSTDYLMSKECRDNIAISIKSCRKLHGKKAAQDFYNALIHAGAIYPKLAKHRPINSK